MRRLSVKTIILLLVAWPAQAGQIFCDGLNTSVIASDAKDARLACDAVARATTLFEGCNIPALTRPLKIEVIDQIDEGCFGLYHCGADWIELLAPSAMAAKRQPNGIYTDLPIDRFFQSIAVHELTHAAMEDAPCPFPACLVRDEYAAYVMQMMSLTPGQRHQLAERTDLVGRRISRDELNSIMYFMAPERFAVKAWMHFTQRDEPCGFLGQLVDGTVLLDRERFE